MYRLEFLPIANKDIEEILLYISNKLKNKSAAINLFNEFKKQANRIIEFPYGTPVYNKNNKLLNEYRCVRVNNFLMFYTINEKQKLITVVRVLYKKININNFLE